VVLAISSGGLTFDPGMTYEQPDDLDGVSSPVEGLDLVPKYNSTVSGTQKQFRRRDLERLHAGIFAAPAAPGQPRILTPPRVNTYLPVGPNGPYIRDFRFWTKRNDGTYVAVHFASCLPSPNAFKSQSKAAEQPVTYGARVIPNAACDNLDECPYKLEEYATAPALAAPGGA
jgi:hypothetical protein